MKVILATLLILSGVTAYSQSEKYMETMKKNLSRFDSVKTSEEYQALAATFERIGDAEKTEWLPYYYSSLALLTPGWTDAKRAQSASPAPAARCCRRTFRAAAWSGTARARTRSASRPASASPTARRP